MGPSGSPEGDSIPGPYVCFWGLPAISAFPGFWKHPISAHSHMALPLRASVSHMMTRATGFGAIRNPGGPHSKTLNSALQQRPSFQSSSHSAVPGVSMWTYLFGGTIQPMTPTIRLARHGPWSTLGSCPPHTPRVQAPCTVPKSPLAAGYLSVSPPEDLHCFKE